VLDQDEILETDYVCEALETLVVTTEEEPGVNCEWGGQRIDSGLDADGDGVLDESEILETTYACSGPDGYQTVVNVTDEAPGDNCPAGGKRIDVGADENRDGELDTGEIDQTTYVCNGYASLTETTEIAPGAACQNGGTLMEIGLDEDGDGVLSPREVQTHEVICNEVAPTTVAPEGGSCSVETQGSSGRSREALGVLALAGLALVRRRRR
jgi:MYXO-CTERM domain-containing protein